MIRGCCHPRQPARPGPPGTTNKATGNYPMPARMPCSSCAGVGICNKVPTKNPSTRWRNQLIDSLGVPVEKAHCIDRVRLTILR